MTYGISNGLNVNTGYRFGNGYVSSTGSTAASSSSYTTRNASNINLTRIAQDVAQGYNQDLEVINLYLQQGSISKAITAYDRLIDNVKLTANNYGYNLTDSQITSIANQAFFNATGMTFINSISDSTGTSFEHGLAEGIPFIGSLFTQPYTDAEAIAKITGTEVEAGDVALECAGAALPRAAIGAVAGAVAVSTAASGSALAGLKIGAIAGGPAGAIAGAIVGTLIGVGAVLIKNAFQK